MEHLQISEDKRKKLAYLLFAGTQMWQGLVNFSSWHYIHQNIFNDDPRK